jgi:hypothetical protein
MRKCPKCEKAYPDEAKICRTCGAILDALTESESGRTAPARADPEVLNMFDDLPREENPSVADSAENLPEWICSQCQQSVPGNFEVCWNCFSSRDDKFNPAFAEKAVANSSANQAEVVMAEAVSLPRENRLCCSRCGSDKIIPDARVLDQGRNSDGQLYMMVYGDPEALIFKDRLYGRLSAAICGRCGHVEFRVDNPGELYEHYRKSRS